MNSSCARPAGLRAAEQSPVWFFTSTDLATVHLLFEDTGGKSEKLF